MKNALGRFLSLMVVSVICLLAVCTAVVHAEQDGHGGNTQVIARIKAGSSSESASSLPSSQSDGSLPSGHPESSEAQPTETGDGNGYLFAAIGLMLCSAAVGIALSRKSAGTSG